MERRYKVSKDYLYEGFIIKNLPLEFKKCSRWLTFYKDGDRVDYIPPKSSLKEVKKYIDNLISK